MSDELLPPPMEATLKGVDSTKQLLQWLFKTKSSRLTLRSNSKGKNRFVWRQFRLAYIDDTEQPYAMCVDCQTFVKYSGMFRKVTRGFLINHPTNTLGRTGTGGLVRHHCFRQVIASMETNDDEPPIPELPKPSINAPARQEVEELVHQNSQRIGYVPNYKGKSNVWAQFDIITVDKKAVNFAACKICRSIVTYVSRTGTGSMARHKCQMNKRTFSPERDCPSAEDLVKKVKTEQEEVEEEPESSSEEPTNLSGAEIAQLQLSAFSQMLQANLQNFGPKSEPRPPPREPPEDAVRREYVKMVRRSLDVFHAMRNEAFFGLAQSLVNLGAEYGKIDIRQLLTDTSDLANVFNPSD